MHLESHRPGPYRSVGHKALAEERTPRTRLHQPRPATDMTHWLNRAAKAVARPATDMTPWQPWLNRGRQGCSKAVLLHY